MINHIENEVDDLKNEEEKCKRMIKIAIENVEREMMIAFERLEKERLKNEGNLERIIETKLQSFVFKSTSKAI